MLSIAPGGSWVSGLTLGWESAAEGGHHRLQHRTLPEGGVIALLRHDLNPLSMAVVMAIASPLPTLADKALSAAWTDEESLSKIRGLVLGK